MKTLIAPTFLLLVVSLLFSLNTAASPEPVLQLQTGRHTAAIIRIAVDAKEQLLVTASHDKTALVWDLTAKGKLVQTLRPPLGAGDEGKLYAVAIKPLGDEVAVGGFTAPNGSDERIYIFNPRSGQLLRSLGQLPETVGHLAYSADGRYLAAALGKTGGIRVYDAASLQEVYRDSDYGSDSYSVEFDPHNRLLTTSFDGFIRLYQPNAALVKKAPACVTAKNCFLPPLKQALTGGNKPFAARFSPDAHLIAVGFGDTAAVQVLNATNLSLAYAADTQTVTNGHVSSVA